MVDLGRRQLYLGSPRQFEPGVLAEYAYIGAVTCNADSQAQGTCQVTANFDQGKSTNRTDARLQWTSAEGRWGLGVYGKNIFDNQYVQGINNITASVLGTPFASISDPVQYGIEGKFNF